MRRDSGTKFWRFMECIAPLYVIAFIIFVAGQSVWRAFI